MSRPHDRTALVTGASSGIGEAAVRQLAAVGYTVHGVARRADRLDALASATGCVPHSLDVRDTGDVLALADELSSVDVLVNNAGLGRMESSLANAAIDDVTRTIDTNVTALLVMTMAFLPGMVERGRGHILNVGSMAGLYPLASAIYGASKAAVHRLSTNLRLELRGTNVRVTEVCPGRVATEFYDVAYDDLELRAKAKDSGIDELTADDVAEVIVYALGVPQHVNINRIELQPTRQTYGGMQFD